MQRLLNEKDIETFLEDIRYKSSPNTLSSNTVQTLLTLLITISTTLAQNNGQYYSYAISNRASKNQATQQSYPSKNLIKVYEVKNVEFGFPTENERRAALASGRYNPDSPIPIDCDVYYPDNGGREKVFMTMPRFGDGVPYSLAVLTDVQKPNGTQIQPYPNYDWHSSHGADCNGLTSVYRVAIDPCNQMWILDSGEIDFVQYCSPQIVVIDLATDQLIHRYRLPEGTFKPNISRFVTPIVDVADPPPNGNCKETFVYMADPTGAGIVVYDVVNRNSWRIENKYTYPDPDFGTHTVAGQSFELLDGTLSLAVTPPRFGKRRMLFLHSLSSDLQVAIPLDVVNNVTRWGLGISSALDEFIPIGKRGIQCGIAAMTSEGVLLCGHLNPIAIFGWHIGTKYTEKNRKLLIENSTTLQFVSGMKVKNNRNCQEEVWMLSNRLQKSFTGTTNYSEINYRIQRIGVDELLRGIRWRNCGIGSRL